MHERLRLSGAGCGRIDEPDRHDERTRKDATSPARAFRRRRELGLLVFERRIRHEELLAQPGALFFLVFTSKYGLK